MANEIMIQNTVRVDNGYNQRTEDPGSFQIDQTGKDAAGDVQEIGFSAHEAIAMGDVGTPGAFYFRNLEAEGGNFLQIGVDVGATFYPFLKLAPGCFVSGAALGTSAPYAKADTGACKLKFWILEA